MIPNTAPLTTAPFTVVSHPLLQRDLTILRDRKTPHDVFRRTLADAAGKLAYEALRGLDLEPFPIETPLEPTTGYRITHEVAVVAILRAGLGMIDGFLQHVPTARVGHLGMYRDDVTRRPVDYYSALPPGLDSAHVFVVDPMLATGGSASRALTHLKAAGARRLMLICLVAAPEGVARLAREHPEVPIIAAALDRDLNERAFIRPGLGDAGDRTFGTT